MQLVSILGLVVAALCVSLSHATEPPKPVKFEAAGMAVYVMKKSGALNIVRLKADDDDDDDDDDSEAESTTTSTTTTTTIATTTTTVAASGRRRRDADKKEMEEGVHVKFTSLNEINSTGVYIGVSNETTSAKHGLASFAEVDFTVDAEAKEATIPGSTIKAAKFAMTSTPLADFSGKLVVDVYIAKEDGNMTQKDETSAVAKGNVKFTVTLSNWHFCEASGTGTKKCLNEDKKEEIGSGVELRMEVGAGKTAEKDGDAPATGPLKYSLGNGIMCLSKKLKKDSVWADMATGFPKVSAVADHDKLTDVQFRFPAFATDLVYDPVFQVDAKGGEGVSGALPVSSASSLSVLLGVALVAAVRMWWY